MTLHYDRPIHISAGASRNATRWPVQNLYVSELYDRLRMPARGAETLETYIRLKKSQQVDLKDVGGFVGGIVHNGGRRKRDAIDSRDVLTLDLDHIPAGKTDDVLRRVNGLNCSYCVYSTRKHSPAGPRLRVILPLNRTVTADEYEPIARMAAKLIGIELCDPSTFEASRLMYWPSCCSDSQYIYQYADKLFLSADGVLALYAKAGQDWHDMSTWPQVPGAAGLAHAPAAKQQDPTTKPGIIGAFCRVYNIYAVMGKYLAGVYVPTDQPDRYTYAAGSTTGGAIVYDNGLYLYSHHATDPAGGQLCNSYDLVRLHMFGAKDDAARPGTPTNRLPSYIEMQQLAKSDPAVSRQINAERGAQVLADFGDLAKAQAAAVKTDVDRQIEIGKLEDVMVTTDAIRKVLAMQGITTRLNVISNKAEISGAGVPAGWSPENAVNNLPTYLRDFCRTAKMSGVSKDAIMDSLSVIDDECRYNPVLDLLSGIQWDGQDRMPTIYAILGQTDPFLQTLIRKWLWQCVAMAHNTITAPYGADGVLTLTGKGGIGKTSFFHWLAADDALFAEGVSLDSKDKDTIIAGLRAWIAELGELDGTLAHNLAWLKAFITQRADNLRLPYARSATDRPRRTSFCATVNGELFLRDPTGNRRFWTIHVDTVDLDQMRSLDHDWLRQMWVQVSTWYVADHQGFRLTREEQKQLEAVNSEHIDIDPLIGQVEEFLERPIPHDWQSWDANRRSMFWGGEITGHIECVPRDRVCVVEIWHECLQNRYSPSRADSYRISNILSNLPGWKSIGTRRFINYGNQKCYARVQNLTENGTTSVTTKWPNDHHPQNLDNGQHGQTDHQDHQNIIAGGQFGGHTNPQN